MFGCSRRTHGATWLEATPPCHACCASLAIPPRVPICAASNVVARVCVRACAACVVACVVAWVRACVRIFAVLAFSCAVLCVYFLAPCLCVVLRCLALLGMGEFVQWKDKWFPQHVSLESVRFPNHYVTHRDGQVIVAKESQVGRLVGWLVCALPQAGLDVCR